MILQALYELAQDEELIQDPDFEPKPISFFVRLAEDGRFLGFVSNYHTPPQEGKKKPRPVAGRKVVPRCGARTSGDRAFFLFDKAEYVLGLDPDGTREAEKLKVRFDLFRDEVRNCHEESGEPGVGAVLAFLNAVEAGSESVELPEGCAGNDLFAFVVAPDVDELLIERPQIRAYWKEKRRQEEEDVEKATCLVLGKEAAVADLFPQLKRVPGGSTSGVGFVSFNAPAFCSYGWKNNENAPISREAAEACATALNRLLDPAFPHPVRLGETLPKRNLRLSADTVVAYWARGDAGEAVCSVFGGLFDGDPEQVGEAYRSVWRGVPPSIDDPSAFYALILTGQQGRAIVRDWFESTVSDVLRNLARYFADIDIVRNTPKPKKGPLPVQLPLGRLLESLAVQGKRENIPAPLSAQFVHAALAGSPFPFSVLQRAVERTRAEIGNTDWLDLARRDARAALIKAVLNRRNKTTEVRRDMDPNNKEPGYLFGRLMAVIERMQQLALGNVNATVIDRFFAGASATPASAFPRLLKGMRHHASKAKDGEGKGGTVRWLEQEVDAILFHLEAFPAHLDVTQQGFFVLGYHHQRHWLWLSKEKREELARTSGNGTSTETELQNEGDENHE